MKYIYAPSYWHLVLGKVVFRLSWTETLLRGVPMASWESRRDVV